MPKKSRQKFKYLENEKSFKDEIKAFFIIFEGLSLKQIKKTLLEGESPTLNWGFLSAAYFIKTIRTKASLIFTFTVFLADSLHSSKVDFFMF